MKWKATADILVDEGRAETIIEASGPLEADALAYKWAYENRALDAGTVEIEPMEEDKQLICNFLLQTLWLTRQFYDVEDLTYSKDEHTETVTALFRSGYTKIANVSMDSGAAMIRDILRQIA